MSVTDTFAEFQRFEQQQQSVETQQLRQLTNKGQKGQLPRQIQRGKSEKQENQAVPLSVSLLPSSIIEMGGINAQFQRNADSDLSKFPLERFKGLIFNRLMLERLIESPQFDKCIVGLYSRVLVSSEPVREYGIVEILRISNDIPQDQRYIFAKMYCSKILRAEFSDKTTKQYRLIEFSNSLPELDDIIKWAQDKLNSGNELPTLQQIEKKERDLKQVFEDLNRRKKQKEQKPQIISDKQLALQIIELKDLIEAAKEEGDNIKAFELNKKLQNLDMRQSRQTSKTQDNNKSEQLMKRANDALTHKSINKEEEEEYERQRQLKKYIETMQAKPKNALVNIFDPGVLEHHKQEEKIKKQQQKEKEEQERKRKEQEQERKLQLQLQLQQQQVDLEEEDDDDDDDYVQDVEQEQEQQQEQEQGTNEVEDLFGGALPDDEDEQEEVQEEQNVNEMLKVKRKREQDNNNEDEILRDNISNQSSPSPTASSPSIHQSQQSQQYNTSHSSSPDIDDDDNNNNIKDKRIENQQEQGQGQKRFRYSPQSDSIKDEQGNGNDNIIQTNQTPLSVFDSQSPISPFNIKQQQFSINSPQIPPPPPTTPQQQQQQQQQQYSSQNDSFRPKRAKSNPSSLLPSKQQQQQQSSSRSPSPSSSYQQNKQSHHRPKSQQKKQSESIGLLQMIYGQEQRLSISQNRSPTPQLNTSINIDREKIDNKFLIKEEEKQFEDQESQQEDDDIEDILNEINLPQIDLTMNITNSLALFNEGSFNNINLNKIKQQNKDHNINKEKNQQKHGNSNVKQNQSQHHSTHTHSQHNLHPNNVNVQQQQGHHQVHHQQNHHHQQPQIRHIKLPVNDQESNENEEGKKQIENRKEEEIKHEDEVENNDLQ